MKLSHITFFSLLAVVLNSCSSVPKENLFPVQSTLAISSTDTPDSILLKAAHIVPTDNQYEALKNEFIAFIHFGPNTFTRMEWGNGMEDPKIFNLQQLDTDQWCQAMKAAGMKMVILTAKHHDGFVLWQSRYTTHGIMSTPFQNGKGDVMKELSASCKKYGLKLGVYLSPADLFQIESKTGLYGNLSKISKRTIPRPVEGRPFENKTSFEFEVDDYNEYFLNQLFELLTEYGPIDEVWFDGAHPKTKGGQQYNYLAWKKLISTLAPNAVIFGKQDIRWCGNESGKTRDTEWNVMPYDSDPALMNNFADLTDDSLGHPEQLKKAKFLHYQQAETNTSIREGWFYRDDTDQKVRSTDDVFDMYERSVGGNSTFLLNIPPNRDGRFSPEDSTVLNEVGKRITETYSKNLLAAAEAPGGLLDKNDATYYFAADLTKPIELKTAEPITINRFVIQEAIKSHGERVSKHAVDAWIDGEWKEIAQATNIGYKRILRFPELRSDRFRIRLLEARYAPAIVEVAAHYYKTRPPQLAFERSKDGQVTIAPVQKVFNWKPHGENASQNINTGITIRYTTDGSEPSEDAELYTGPFAFKGGEVKAIAIVNGEKSSSSAALFGIAKANWTVWPQATNKADSAGFRAFDGLNQTSFNSIGNAANRKLGIDLGSNYTITAFSYTPPTNSKEGLLQKGQLLVSADGTKWEPAGSFEFGNIINDPSTRKFNLPAAKQARYIKLEATQTSGNGTELRIAELDFIE
ncbi:alpha-L-fucosidase [Flavihumibacter sp. CACIAM 22H1]|uniref:alpha-L-fucosidase n=1 Tax=Flavihumibacter sp. CACIAM 22H1 TaxID=1812911 RepID=UPI0007A8E125|nr:alpha-L-fucosidase [Flavihumibacter sp. CACIAM 22H1]KYP14598.1 MAG: alpha-1,3/4-fucosidase [Flavihumibacter sp. CACIAM 22H1]